MHVALVLDRINWAFQFVETRRSLFFCYHVPNSDNMNPMVFVTPLEFLN